MPINTVSVGAAVTPTVIETYISHYLNRKPLHQKPTAHITYHEGLELIRRFLHYASFHTVEELQAFTSQWVPVPHWVHVKEVEISNNLLSQSATHIQAQLGPRGIRQIGGTKWWQWRRDDAPLKAEWIEMRGDHEQRKKPSYTKGKRIMLYVHGGAYFFGSVDEHRYQMQRHARKLKARVLAPRYRLAPQFPFPCGLMDCLAAYLYLLEEGHEPSTILLAGDSAGGGMVVSILVTLRDQGIPLPAGAILISPWVDLTHSFPSLGGDGKMDYIPAHGFVHKPSLSWPPPNADDMLTFESKGLSPVGKGTKSPPISLSKSSKEENKAESKEGKDTTKEAQKEAHDERVHGFTLRPASEQPKEDFMRPPGDNDIRWIAEDEKFSIGPKSMLSVNLEGTSVDIKDQIQLYAANHLLTHPLVSPVLQPSLGGLPPLLIQVGGGELLRDEQVYLAHKAATPLAYQPRPSNHQTKEHIQAEAIKHRPTNVQLQLWDDLCHVGPTLSFTRPAKYMYRSIAQFGAWALARAQKTSIDILDDDDVSVISVGSSSSSESNVSPDDIKLNMPNSVQNVGFESIAKKEDKPPHSTVGRAGDPLPSFNNHMIRQQVNRHGRIRDMPPASEIEALNIPSSEIGVPKAGPVNKWMKAQKQWNSKFAKQKIKVQKKRLRDMEKGYEGFDGETPPPTALAGRRVKGMTKEKSKKKSWGMALWSLWGSKHDEATIQREQQADQNTETATEEKKETAVEDDHSLKPVDGAGENKSKDTAKRPRPKKRKSSFRSGLSPAPTGTRPRSRSRHSTVTDRGQINTSPTTSISKLAPPGVLGLAEATSNAPEVRGKASPLPSPRSEISEIPSIVVGGDNETLVPATSTNSTRPFKGPVAYPFRLKVDGADESKNVNASMVTLESVSVEEAGAEPVDIPAAEDSEVANAEGKMDTTVTAVNNVERPAPERFVTAGAGELNEIAFEKEKTGEAGIAQRPGVERFETAQEDLNTIANKSTS